MSAPRAAASFDLDKTVIARSSPLDDLTALRVGLAPDQVNTIVAETLHELIPPMVYTEAVALSTSTTPPAWTS